ncbi:MAG: CapA family protein [Armatimonadia bacterium]
MPVLVVFVAVVVLAGALGALVRPAASPTGLTVAAAAEPTPQAQSDKKQFTMIAVGDMMTDRNVGDAIRRNGSLSILEKVRELTRSADVSFANLECPLSTSGPHAPKDCVFRARPETVAVVKDGGFDIVSLANNHSLNAGREGVLQTLEILDKQGIPYCGARRDRTKGGEASYLKVGQGPVTVGFIAATDLSFGHGSYNKVDPDRANLIAQIQAARPLCDILCVSFHWGDEYQSLPNQRQRNTAHAAVRAGADLILGHHPHTLQGVEVYQGKPILYSMGNFVFDQREGERMESAIFHLEWVQGWGWQIFAKPVWIPRSRMGPIYPEVARRDRILARLTKISKPLGTTLQVKDGKAWLRVAEK